MTGNTFSLCLIAGLSLMLGACATPAPVEPVTMHTPLLLHDMAIANPPHPQVRYVDYMDEPTRFEFRPRNIIMLDETDDGTGMDQAVDYGGDTGCGEE